MDEVWPSLCELMDLVPLDKSAALPDVTPEERRGRIVVAPTVYAQITAVF
jgi:hypothetical protein